MKSNRSMFLRAAPALVAALSLFHVTAAEERPLVIRAAHILPVSSPEINDGILLIEKGKITALGTDISVPGQAAEIDAGSGWVMPGFIQCCTTLGSVDRYGGGSSSDEISDPNTAQMRITDGINPFAKSLVQARMAGVTTILAAPGRLNVIGGQAAVLKLRGVTVEDMCLLSPAGIKISLGEGPKETYGKKGRLPSTRMGSAYVLRSALIEAEAYSRSLEEYERAKSKAEKAKSDLPAEPKRDLRLEPLARLRKGELTALIECYRADDIMTALRIVEEFKLKAVLVGCSEGARLAEPIARAGVPVIVSPFGVGPRRMETGNLSRETAALLHAAGVKVVIRADEALGIGHVRELPLQAALAVSGGLARQAALRAITLYAAETAGVADRVGSLEPGKDADIVILDGDPLDIKTRVVRVMIEGETVYSLDGGRKGARD